MVVKAVVFGGIAQLVERLHGMQEVSGSTPLISTNSSLLLTFVVIPSLVPIV
jgi:hypothetical protein